MSDQKRNYALHAVFLIPFFLLISTVSISQSRRAFKAGDTLPELNLKSIFDDTVKLKGKWTLITFNRYVSCPLCNFRTHELIQHRDTLEKYGLTIVSVYESSRETLAGYALKDSIPFILIADSNEVLYRQFSIQKSWSKSFRGLFKDYRRKHAEGRRRFKGKYKREGDLNRIGADFLVDSAAVIRVAYYGKYVGDHLPIEDILKWIKKIRT